MSLPVQILVADDALRPAVDGVCRRLGRDAAGRLAWVLGCRDLPELPARVAEQAQQLLEARGAAGEAGLARVVVASDLDGLKATTLESWPEEERPPTIGIVLAEASDSAALDALRPRYDALHVVPREVGMRRLVRADREQIAANLLGLALELAARADGAMALRQWLGAYPGLQVTVAHVMRFNGPAIRRRLARGLAARVAGRMRRCAEGDADLPPPAISEPPLRRLVEALDQDARALGQRLAAELDDLDEADPEAAQRVLGRLPDHVRELVSDKARAGTRAARQWQREASQAVDVALGSHGFAALEGLQARLDAVRAQVQGALDRLGRVPERIDLGHPHPPEDAELLGARAALEAASGHDARWGYLFAGWTLVAASLGAVLLQPWLGHFGADAGAIPGGGYTAAGLGVAGLGALVGGTRRRIDKSRLARLASRLDDARRRYRDAWAETIAGHVATLGRFLEARILRDLLAHIEAERARLRAVVDTVARHATRNSGATGPEVPRDGGRTFDGDVELGPAFYDAARMGAAPEELFRRAEAALGQPDWRRELFFMDDGALLSACEAAFEGYDTRLPLEQRQDLLTTVAPASHKALQHMLERLDRFVAPGDPAARYVLVPEPLLEAIPAAVSARAEVWTGRGDLFAAVGRSL